MNWCDEKHASINKIFVDSQSANSKNDTIIRCVFMFTHQAYPTQKSISVTRRQWRECFFLILFFWQTQNEKKNQFSFSRILWQQAVTQNELICGGKESIVLVYGIKWCQMKIYIRMKINHDSNNMKMNGLRWLVFFMCCKTEILVKKNRAWSTLLRCCSCCFSFIFIFFI